MSLDFVLIHGGGGTAAAWSLVERHLHQMGHRTVAMDLPADDPKATWDDYAQAVLDAVGSAVSHPVVVGHSAGGFIAPLVCERLQASSLILVAPMIPRPGETFMEYWGNTGHERAQADWLLAQELDFDGNGMDDRVFYHDVPDELRDLDKERSKGRGNFPNGPWQMGAWPDLPTRVLACRQDRMFPLPYLRRVARERLGLEIEEIDGGHCVLYSRPEELAGHLVC